jgi:hypothetical protein
MSSGSTKRRMFLFFSVRLMMILFCMLGVASGVAWLFERGLVYVFNRACAGAETIQCTLFP